MSLVTDPALPAAEHLTGPEAAHVVAAAVDALGGTFHGHEVKGVQYRPGQDLVVHFRVDVSWPTDTAARRDTILAAVSARGQLPGTLPVTATIDGHDVVVSLWRWPFDPAVPGISDAATPGSRPDLLGPFVGEHSRRQVVAYRPTERAVVRATGNGATVYMKAVPPAEVAALVDRHTRLVAAGLPVPRVVASDESGGLVVLEELTGTTLRERIKAGEDVLVVPGELSAVADAIASVDPTGLPELPGRISDALGHAALIERVAPFSTGRLDVLRPRFVAALAAAEARRTTVHGDLHEGQVIVDDSGRITGILDVDTLSVGDPLDDVVTVLGHLTYRSMRDPGPTSALDALVAAVRDDAAARFGSDLVDLGTAAVLVGLATGPFRMQSDDWVAETDAVLTAAVETVEGP